MSRYPNAIWRGTNKHGYLGNVTHGNQGLVIHSAEGSLAGLFSVLDGPRQASWHFSMTQDGRVFQHVDTASVAWTNGSYDSNTRFWGIECEGGGPGNFGEPLTEAQYQALVGVVRWLWEAHGLTGWLTRYERQQTLWEHNEMTRFGAASTSCPSGRIPWTRLIADLEDDMPTIQELEGKIRQLEAAVFGHQNEHPFPDDRISSLHGLVSANTEAIGSLRLDEATLMTVAALRQTVYGDHHPDDRISIVDRKVAELAARDQEAGLKRGDSVDIVGGKLT